MREKYVEFNATQPRAGEILDEEANTRENTLPSPAAFHRPDERKGFSARWKHLSSSQLASSV